MQNVSEGVTILSQDGSRSVLTAELVTQGLTQDTILDSPIFDSHSVQGGTGYTFFYLVVDRYHQWVSTISRLAPSPDYMVGVADLRLCDGDTWKERVKVCLELFSTATNDTVGRNSVQFDYCSFGFIEFNLMKTQVNSY